MKQQTGDLDAGIARQRVAEISILPARIRLDHQHLQLLFANRNRGLHVIVVDQRFIAVLRHVERQREIADRLRLPRDPLAGPSHRGDADLLRDLFTVGSFQHDRRRILARQRAIDREWNSHRLTRDAKRRRVEAQEFNIRQPIRTPDRHCKDGNPFESQPRRGLHRRLSFVPVAIRNQNDPQ